MTRAPLPPARYALVVVALAGWLAGMRLTTPESTVSQWVSNAGLLGVTAAAGLSCLLRARTAGDARRAWLLLGAAPLAWGGGQAVWTWYESVQGREVPFPSLADAGYLLAVPLLVAGLLSLPGSTGGLATHLRLVLDGLMVAVSLGVLGWEVLLSDLLAAGGDTTSSTVIGLAYPVGDVVCGTVALVALVRARHGSRVPVRALLLLVAGTAAFAVGDFGFAWLTLGEQYYSGHLVDAGWFLGFALLGLAARVPHDATTARDEDDGRAAQVGLLAPYVAVVLALAAGAYRMLTLGRLGPFIAWGTLTLVGLLVARQVLALQENAALTRHLERRVEQRTAELAGQERWFRSLVSNLSDVVAVLDEDGRITYVTPSSAVHLGRTPQELHGRPLQDWWSLPDAERLAALCQELRDRPGESVELSGEVRDAAGGAVPVESSVTRLPADAAASGFVLSVRDVTERRRLEKELAHQAFHDSLTGLANRALFTDRVGRALSSSRRTGRGLAVLFLDLDGFKAVNDSLGHGAGDELLGAVSARLLAGVRPGDTVARLGGDEFAVLLEDLPEGDDGSTVAAVLAAAISAPVRLGGREVTVRTSCGIAQGADSADGEELLRNADLAMYRAKARSGGVAHYERGMHAELLATLQLEEDLREALDRGQLEVWYQPTLVLSDGTWNGCEALLRWRHPERGLVPPLDFIPTAESSGAIVPIGAWVLQEACRQTAHWRSSRPELAALTVAVNVSSVQLDDPGFLAVVDEALSRSGLPPAALTVELTESVLVEHTEEVLAVLHALTARGVRLAIDDFGTGYSSLSYLHRFPVDVLKVDRAFVAGMSTSSSEAELTRTIVRLGQSLGLVVVAEGIEDRDQLSALQGMGCDLGQGFLFSRPAPPDQLEADLDAALLVPRPRVPSDPAVLPG